MFYVEWCTRKPALIFFYLYSIITLASHKTTILIMTDPYIFLINPKSTHQQGTSTRHSHSSLLLCTVPRAPAIVQVSARFARLRLNLFLFLRLMRRGLRVSLSFLYTVVVLSHMDWCIRLLALTFFYHIFSYHFHRTTINHHTDICPLSNI